MWVRSSWVRRGAHGCTRGCAIVPFELDPMRVDADPLVVLDHILEHPNKLLLKSMQANGFEKQSIPLCSPSHHQPVVWLDIAITFRNNLGTQGTGSLIVNLGRFTHRTAFLISLIAYCEVASYLKSLDNNLLLPFGDLLSFLDSGKGCFNSIIENILLFGHTSCHFYPYRRRMEPKFMSVGKRDATNMGKENNFEHNFCPHTEKSETEVSGDQGEEEGEASGVAVSCITPVSVEENRETNLVHRCSSKKHKSESSFMLENLEVEKKDKREAIDNGVDLQILNDALCIALDSIWFLTTRNELNGITHLMKLIITNGARDFTRAILRTSFLASCVSACQSSRMSTSDTQAIMAQRLHERLQECNGDELLKAEASVKVQKFTEWAMKCICVHSRGQGNGHRGECKSLFEVQLHLSAFRNFLDHVGDQITGKDFTEAFDAACFPLTLFSSSFEPGWASGTSAATMRGLLGMLVEGGADNVNQCLLEASRFGSTELVRILLQIAERNSLDVDVDLALGFAAYYCKIGTMTCLVDDGHASAFLVPLMKAAERVACLLSTGSSTDDAPTWNSALP
ncbi:hypothetical protein HPP92_001747 [Vanilla planifolia]|uniref:Ankyrin repeat protein SKIP35 n=1 Tax=Vanilla planifolia TaxID=51239 RepID=A0A835S772_VANPL|nr:hypothetical protein HPP92_001747 [Vanilla planifolia]